MQNYADLLFTDAVKAYQAREGMKDRYEQVYETRFRDDLDDRTKAFIETRDSFYIASLSENNWPYVQHRGGPPGFVKVLGGDQIGFADYTGNKQFISRGNFDGSARVSLFFMNYPTRSRLKMLGEARMMDASDDPELAATLHQKGEGPVERLVTIKIVARDWNCPKYITPRFTEPQIHEMLGEKLNELVTENAHLKARLAKYETQT